MYKLSATKKTPSTNWNGEKHVMVVRVFDKKAGNDEKISKFTVTVTQDLNQTREKMAGIRLV